MGKIVMNRPVLNSINFRLDEELGRKALLVEVKAKKYVPVEKGLLQNAGSSKRISFGRFRVEFNKEYAGYQHRGRRLDGSHVVRRYTTPGTGKEYLSRAAHEVMSTPIGKVTK